ncbi:SDR family oxidoreductase [Aquimarina brevivitae]|uniref:Enoyl-[acyl-carrier protein] reductase I n=1 Tax=Aquimarina brevivitae TaxID=323412 RepID=A0A4Q7P264_9FLAO|nr:SDR family oxidoreductase [Aquimarina brevivitae]RZS93834.1 enoyl-[acyl-carrier protein] reductase I [Aquimarina brevivitae]
MKEFNTDQYALILGGSKGLGAATALKLATHGMNIIIVHRDRRADQEEIDRNFAAIRAQGVSLLTYNIDLLNTQKRLDTITTIKAQIGPKKLKSLIHSIAKGNLKPMIGSNASLKNDDFHLTIDAMSISLYDWVKTCFDQEMFAEDTRILAFSSEGSSKAWPNYAAVSAAKASLEAIVRNIALEFATHNIKANCLQPGAVDTASLRMIPGFESIIKHSIERNPYNRLTTPQDVANVVYLLCKDEAAWINGCLIPVNGGEHIN